MKEVFLKEGHSIFTFKGGSTITRVVPILYETNRFNDNLGINQVVESRECSSYIGEPFKFLGIYNNTIWLERLIPIDSAVFGKLLRLDMKYEDGWDVFEMPEGITIKDLR